MSLKTDIWNLRASSVWELRPGLRPQLFRGGADLRRAARDGVEERESILGLGSEGNGEGAGGRKKGQEGVTSEEVMRR